MPDKDSKTHSNTTKDSGLSLQSAPVALISFSEHNGRDAFSFNDDDRPKGTLAARYYRDEDVSGMRLPTCDSTAPIFPPMPDNPSNACFAMVRKHHKKSLVPMLLSTDSEPRPLTSAWSGMISRGDRVTLVAAGFDEPTLTNTAFIEPDWVVQSEECSRVSLGLKPSGK